MNDIAATNDKLKLINSVLNRYFECNNDNYYCMSALDAINEIYAIVCNI